MRLLPERELHEECGVLALYNVPFAARQAYLALQSLQHRGQQSCGIATSCEGIHLHKAAGLVRDVFCEEHFAALPGSMAIGHVRYPTTEVGGVENIQPFRFSGLGHCFTVAHNGNIVNADALKPRLEQLGHLFHSTSDSELFAHLIGRYGMDRAANMLDGAFSTVVLTEDTVFALRDKYGFRPLSIGRLGEGYVIASETCALSILGASFLRDVEPGEIVSIGPEGLKSHRYARQTSRHMCAMEYIYFARPDSVIEGCGVHSFRKTTGRLLYREHPVEADIVICVPESSFSAAIGYSEESGIPLEMGLIKNTYVARTFIQPSQSLRDIGVKMKLTPVPGIVGGKRVVVVDDSVVRGTTSRQIVRMLRGAGATQVHICIASPVYAHPCFYGIDTGTADQLIGSGHSVEEIRSFIGADTLSYLSERALYRAAGREGLCTACFSGKYPTDLYRKDKEK